MWIAAVRQSVRASRLVAAPGRQFVRALASKNVVEGTDANFDSVVLKSQVPVIVDFYADWCPPCKVLAPIITKAVEKESGKVTLVKINVDNESDRAAQYGIVSIPTVIAFKNGKQVDTFKGAQSEAFVSRFINNLLQ